MAKTKNNSEDLKIVIRCLGKDDASDDDVILESKALDINLGQNGIPKEDFRIIL